MKLNKGNILIETLIALMVIMIMTQTIYSLKQLEVVQKKIVVDYEKGL